MAELNDRRLPVGIQSFYKIREEGYVYVDKTDLIWSLANKGKKYNCLSRPRRFRKSVLVDTLHSENPRQVVDDWIDEYQLARGDFDTTTVQPIMNRSIS